jgi:hypothetical protein
MPPATRSRKAADATKDEATTTGATPDVPAPASTDAETASPATAGAADHRDTRAPDVADLVRTVERAATLPVKVVMTVADDIASTAHRPDAVLYWGGLAGLAALGIFEWPVAAAVGVGVAVANGRRRPRPQQPTAQLPA